MLPWLQTLLASDAIIDGGVASDLDNSFHYFHFYDLLIMVSTKYSLQLFLASNAIVDGGELPVT